LKFFKPTADVKLNVEKSDCPRRPRSGSANRSNISIPGELESGRSANTPGGQTHIVTVSMTAGGTAEAAPTSTLLAGFSVNRASGICRLTCDQTSKQLNSVAIAVANAGTLAYTSNPNGKHVNGSIDTPSALLLASSVSCAYLVRNSQRRTHARTELRTTRPSDAAANLAA